MKELTILRAALAESWDIDERAAIQRGIDVLAEILVGTDTEKMPVLCAWCLSEQGIEPRSEDSHGICARHAAQVAEQSRARRAARLARVA